MLVWLYNPITGWRKAIRVLLDSGATTSIISMKWVTECQLKQEGKCMVDITTFGNTTTEQVATMVKVKVCKDEVTPDCLTMNVLAIDKFANYTSCYKLTRKQELE